MQDNYGDDNYGDDNHDNYNDYNDAYQNNPRDDEYRRMLGAQGYDIIPHEIPARNQGLREVTDPAILAQLNSFPSIQEPKSPSTAGLKEVTDPKILAQLNGGNVPQGTSEQKSEQKQEPSISDRAMVSFLHQQSPYGPSKNYDPNAEKLNIAEKIGTGLMDFAPYIVGAGGALKAGAAGLSKLPRLSAKVAEFAAKNPKIASFLPNLAENAGAGAAYGGVNAESGSRLKAAAKGAWLGALSSAGGAALSPVAGYLYKKYAQSAIPELTGKATEAIRKLMPSSEQAAKLQGNYEKSALENKGNWKAAEESANQLDKGKPRYKISASGEKTEIPSKSTFENAPYHSYIDQFKERISRLEPAKREPYMQALKIADKAREMAPESFGGSVALRKNINQAMKEHLEKSGEGFANSQSKSFLSGLKKNLVNDTLEANKKNINPEQYETFKNQWEKANQSHQGLQEFFKTPNQLGTVKSIKQIKEAYQSGQPIDAALIGKYMPKPSQTGIEGLKQLEKVMGSKEAAQEAAKSHFFRSQIENGAKTVDTAAQYAKLSPAQREYMFGNSKDGQILETINNARKAFGREPNKTLSKVGHGAAIYGIPGLFGYESARTEGANPIESLLAGAGTALGAKIGRTGFSKTVTPSRMQSIINRSKQGTQNKGRYLNILAQRANQTMNQPQMQGAQ